MLGTVALSDMTLQELTGEPLGPQMVRRWARVGVSHGAANSARTAVMLAAKAAQDAALHDLADRARAASASR